MGLVFASDRRVALGGLCLLVGAGQFLVAMLAVQAAYPGYSAIANFVSDLGATGSPQAWLFNLSLWILGTLGAVGTYLALPALPKGRVALAGATVLFVTWVFAFLVGIFPEQTGSIHTNISGVAFLGAALSLAILGSAFGRDDRWRSYRLLTLASAAVTAVALVLFIVEPGGRSIQGVWERLVVLPIMFWSAVVGARMSLSTMTPSTVVPHRGAA